jgi:hypothetical protein
VLAQLHAGGQGLRVASAIEGQATQLSAVLPKILIVPEVRYYLGRIYLLLGTTIRHY